MQLVFRLSPTSSLTATLVNTSSRPDIRLHEVRGLALPRTRGVFSQIPGTSRARVNDVLPELPQEIYIRGTIIDNVQTVGAALLAALDGYGARQVPDGTAIPALPCLDWTPDGVSPTTYRRDVIVREFDPVWLHNLDSREFEIVLESYDSEWYDATESEDDLSAGANTITIVGDRPVYPRIELEADASPFTNPVITGTTDGGRTMSASTTISTPDTLVLNCDPNEIAALIGSTRMDSVMALTDRRFRLFPSPTVSSGENTVTVAYGSGTPATAKIYWRERYAGLVPWRS